MSKSIAPAERVRRFCLAFQDAAEVIQFGHPFFKWRGKPFTILSGHDDGLLSIKVEKEVQLIFLQDPRFTRTAYVGQHGWVSMRLTSVVDWQEIEALIEGSYRLVSTKKRKANTRRT